MATGRKGLVPLLAVAAGLPLAAVLGIALMADGSGALGAQPASSLTDDCPSSQNPSGASAYSDGTPLNAEQIANAQIIYNTGVGLRLPAYGEIIAIATARQESGLLNLPYGGDGSLGLFQQRPSQGWGTPAEIMNPVYAATAFYTRLTEIPGWLTLPLTVAAQAVQHSEFPGAYAQWQPLATALVTSFSSGPVTCTSDSGVPATGTIHLPAGFSLPPGTPLAAAEAIAYAIAQLGKPYIWGGTGPVGYDCSGLVMMAYRAAGISIPRTTYQQVLVGTPVYSLSQLEPGDLLFTAGSDGMPTSPGHVGMYIGSSLVIQAPETGEDIMITPLAGYWQQSTVAIRRIVN